MSNETDHATLLGKVASPGLFGRWFGCYRANPIRAIWLCFLLLSSAHCEAVLGLQPTVASDYAADADVGSTDAAQSDGSEPGRDSHDVSRNDDAEWSPTALAGLVLWLDSANGLQLDEGSRVRGWEDRSSFHHVAAAPTGLEPVFLEHAVGPDPGVLFSGAGDMLAIADHPSLRFGNRSFVIEVLFRHNTPLFNPDCPESFGVAIAAKQVGDTYPFVGPALFANIPAELTPTAHLDAQLSIQVQATTRNYVDAAYNDDIPRLLAIYRHGDVVAIRVNGLTVSATNVPAADGASLNVDAPDQPLTLGSRPARTQCLKGAIAELIASSPIEADDVVQLESYLLLKHREALGMNR